MASVVMKLDGRFQKRLRTVFQGYAADVGVLADKPHRAPLTIKEIYRRVRAKQSKDATLATRFAFLKARFSEYAGGPVRKTGRKTDGTIAGISEKLRKETGINFYTRPFSLKQNGEILKFATAFVGLFLRGGASTKRVENLLQAIVRNPILRGDYGRNSPATAKSKGFNRFMVDTGQLFKNITAKVRGRRVSGGA